MNNNQPLITTIIPTYKRPKLLKRAIFSVLAQTFPNIRVLVLDNASGDETESVVNEIIKIDKRVIYHRHPKNIGSYNNFNFGIKNVETPFFSLLSDDDMLTPWFYEEALNGYEKFPEAMMVCMPTMVIDDNNIIRSEPVIPEKIKIYKKGEVFELSINGEVEVTWTGTLFRTEIRDKIGLVNTSAGPYADGGFVWHSIGRFSIVVSPGVAAILMTHKETTSWNVEPLNKNWLKWIEIMIGDIVNDKNISEDIKAKTKELIKFNSKKIAFQQVIRGLGEGNFEYAEKAAAGAKDFGHNNLSKVLKILIWSYKYIIPARLILIILRKIRKFFIMKRWKELTLKYIDLVKLVNELNKKSGINNG